MHPSWIITDYFPGAALEVTLDGFLISSREERQKEYMELTGGPIMNQFGFLLGRKNEAGAVIK
jgi:hypothetical protein